MKILNRTLLDKFIVKHDNAKSSLSSWMTLIKHNNFTQDKDFKNLFGINNVDYIANNHYVFDIGGNNYRTFVKVVFTQNIMIIKGIYTHSEYDKLNLRKEAKKG